MSKRCTPFEFISGQPPQRIIGIETEYQTPYNGNFEDDAIDSGVNNSGVNNSGMQRCWDFLSNGAKIESYHGIEYATPECAGPRQAAAADHAGMIVVNNVVNNQTIEELSTKEGYPLLKTNGSYLLFNDGERHASKGSIESTGCHQNYLTIEYNATDRGPFMAMIGSFLATKTIWNGNGLVADSFLLSQKADGIGVGVIMNIHSQVDHGQKPLATYHTNNDMANDKISSGWAVLEARYSDTHMPRFCTFVDVAATSAAMRLYEQAVIHPGNIDEFSLAEPVLALRHINRNFGRGSFYLGSGKRTTALSLQMKFLETYLELAESGTIDLPDDEIQGTKEAYRNCELLKGINLKDPDLTPLVRRVEWASKYALLLKKFDGSMFEGKNHQAAITIDRGWHGVDQRINGEKAHKWQLLDPMYNELEAEVQALVLSPPNTRAAARAEAIEAQQCSSVRWDSLLMEPNGQPVSLGDYWDPTLSARDQNEEVA